MRVYLASPLGFNPEHNDYRQRIKNHLSSQGHEIFDPWEQDNSSQAINTALLKESPEERRAAITLAAAYTGKVNASGIESSDVILAVLDGTEIDSGTASEVGYAAGIGKKCYGLRTDFRNMGDLPGLPINLQVMYFITSTGGELFQRTDNITL